MAKAAQSLSAKDFRNPLLKVLATHTKFDSGRTVKAESLYDPICKMMGINQEDHGDTGGVLWVQKWIQWAFRSLREEGLGVKHGRGTWGLTPNGVDKARAMMTSTNNTSKDLEIDDLVAIIAATPIDETLTNKDGTYHPDPYICDVALGGHKCMGFFSSQSPMCTTCPARVLCHQSMMAMMATMAVNLNDADISVAAIAEMAPPKGVDDPTPSDRYVVPKDAVVIEQTCSGTVVCDHCGGMIHDGELSMWVRKVGPNKNKSLMLHRECSAP